MKTKSNDFYSELDNYKRRGGYCNCTTLAVFFVVLIVVLEIFVFSFARGVKYNPKSSDVKIPVGLGTELQSTKVTETEEQVYVPQGVLCSIISKYKKSDLSCLISEEGVEIDGKIGYLLPSNANILLFPQVSNGDLEFVVKRVAIGKVGVPGILSAGIGGIISEAVKGELKGKVEFKRVLLSEAVMTLVFARVK